jgi:hypothetical protein
MRVVLTVFLGVALAGCGGAPFDAAAFRGPVGGDPVTAPSPKGVTPPPSITYVKQDQCPLLHSYLGTTEQDRGAGKRTIYHFAVKNTGARDITRMLVAAKRGNSFTAGVHRATVKAGSESAVPVSLPLGSKITDFRIMLLQYPTPPHRWPQYVRDIPAAEQDKLPWMDSGAPDVKVAFLRTLPAPAGLNALSDKRELAVEFAVRNHRVAPLFVLNGVISFMDARGRWRTETLVFDDGMEIVPGQSTRAVLLPALFPSLKAGAPATLMLTVVK